MRGTVERIGRRELTGIVYARPDEPPVRVCLFLNGLELTETWAVDPIDPGRPERGRAFRFGLYDIWSYAGPADGLSVRVDGSPLPIALRRSAVHRPRHTGDRSITDLRRRLADGYIFGQSGRLQLPKGDDDAWKDVVLDLYDRVRRIVADSFGHDVFLVYGSLLGAVREGGFIGHDLDFDAAYVSRHRDAESVLAEIYDISRVLHAAGLYVRSHSSGLKIAAGPEGGGSIDLMHLYFAEDDCIKFAFGVAGTSTVAMSSWKGTREFELAGHQVLVPVNAEELVEHMYGASWRIPNPGFDWLRDRTSRHRSIIVPVRDRERVRWNNHYLHFPTDEPSPFALGLLGRDDLPRTVLDVGCGDGRDTIAFAESGRRVMGLDRSPDGVAYARDRARELGLADVASLQVVDCCDAGAVGDAVTPLRPDAEPLLFYARFVLHGIDAGDERRLLGALAAAAQPGDVLALEFRTTDDTSRPVWRKYYRRLISTPRLCAKLADTYGFTPFDVQEGSGFSPTDREDPQLARVLARRG